MNEVIISIYNIIQSSINYINIISNHFTSILFCSRNNVNFKDTCRQKLIYH